MIFGKKRAAVREREPMRRDRSLPDGTRYGEFRIRLDKSIRGAVWGTTTIIGKQKK